MNLKKIVFIVSTLAAIHNNPGYAMQQCPIQFPDNTEPIVYSLMFDTNSSEAVIKSIKSFWKFREVCKYFDQIMIPKNIATWLAVCLEMCSIKITEIIGVDDHTVLHAACLEKYDTPILAEIFLCVAGCNVQPLLIAKDADDYSALYCATMQKNSNIIKVLLKHAGDRASMIILMHNGDTDQVTVLSQAVVSNELEIATMVLEAAGSQALQEIIGLYLQIKSFMEIGDRCLECGVPAISQEMVDLLQSYREKYENVDELCQDFQNSLDINT